MPKKDRESQFELLRVVAMFLVLAVHANFAALSFPTHQASIDNTAIVVVRYVAEALSLVCVNVFVLISGWFSIKSSWKGLCKFLFQVLFFGLVLWLFAMAVGIKDFSWEGLRNTFLFTSPLSWFVVSYLGLYILSPVLNAFVEKADKKTQRTTLILFFLFQTLYGWAANSDGQFQNGYSTLSFVGLYLLARYVKTETDCFKDKSRGLFLLLYLGSALLNAAIGFIGCRYDIDGVNNRMVGYTNPLNIFGAMCLLLYFSRLQFKSRFVNILGAGAFGVFLLHLNENIYFALFKQPIIDIAEQYTPALATVLIIGFLLCYFVMGVALDYVRAWVFRLLRL